MKELEPTNELGINTLRDNLSSIDVFSVTALDVRLQLKYPSVRDNLIRLQSKEIDFQSYTRITAQSNLGVLISAYISGRYDRQQLDNLNWILSSQDIDFILKTWKTISRLVLEQYDKFKNGLNVHKAALQKQAASIDQMRAYFLTDPQLLKQLPIFAGFLSSNYPLIYQNLINEQAREEGYEHATYIYPHSKVGVALICVFVHQDPSIIQYIIPGINELMVLKIIDVWDIYEFEIILEATLAWEVPPTTFPNVGLTTAVNNYVFASLEEIEQAKKIAAQGLLELPKLSELGTIRELEFIAYAFLFYPSIDEEEIVGNLRLPRGAVHLYENFIRSLSVSSSEIDDELEELGLIKS